MNDDREELWGGANLPKISFTYFMIKTTPLKEIVTLMPVSV